MNDKMFFALVDSETDKVEFIGKTNDSQYDAGQYSEERDIIEVKFNLHELTGDEQRLVLYPRIHGELYYKNSKFVWIDKPISLEEE